MVINGFCIDSVFGSINPFGVFALVEIKSVCCFETIEHDIVVSQSLSASALSVGTHQSICTSVEFVMKGIISVSDW
jgi:hypothetical protein